MINPKMGEGVKVLWRNDKGWIEYGTVTQQYQSATGVWCLEMTDGRRVPVHKAWPQGTKETR